MKREGRVSVATQKIAQTVPTAAQHLLVAYFHLMLLA